MRIPRRELERLAESATGIANADSPIQRAWITEALEGGRCEGDSDAPEASADAVQACRALRTLAQDVTMYADAVERWVEAPRHRKGAD